ncbi:LOW QUALITY PROTEIN: hypothetical protein U9M48_032120 [Paspalum notatum var. saurae]|uniref:Reverse transcriptase domain-containing protein n=1 Tax=Paspalum notatum var. saurae TaxID=547442 RepID=A0AAQ3U4G4_PASNO
MKLALQPCWPAFEDLLLGRFFFVLDMNPSSILIWNARGLNNKARRNSVREVVLSSKADIVCLQETKVEVMNHFLFSSVFGSEFDKFAALPASGTRGGVLVAWKSSVVQALSSRVDLFSVSVHFVEEEGHNWWFTGVYGPQEDDDKLLFIQELRDVRSLCQGPWLVAGDFNLIYQAEDKNNANQNRAMMGCFRRLLDNTELKEISLPGHKFTWSNERDNPTLVRLDRAFCCSEWEEIFPDAVLQSAASSVSDHCPLILGLKVCTQGKRRFHFESFWPKLPGFEDAVRQNWGAPVDSSCAVERLFLKLQRLSRGLQKWSQCKVGNVKSQLAIAKEILHQLEIARDSRALSHGEEWLRKKLKLHCLGLASLEQTIARLRSRVLYIKEGDANTSYFHQHAHYRKKKNFIAKFQVGDNIIVSQEGKQEAAFDFFNNLLGTAEERVFSFNLPVFHHQQQNQSQLDEPFSVEEVRATIKDMPMDKAPGPDGFIGRFYKCCWGIICNDVLLALSAIHRGHVFNLIHSFAKLVTKILSNRLAPLLPELVSNIQTAFIRGRSIQDNFMLIQQLARLLHRSKQPHVLLKLDMTKAFDSISWSFLLEVLQHLGFGRKWCNLICMLLATASTQVLVNGQPGQTITHLQGLRQGDPLSPMLFTLVMDVLNSLVAAASRENVFLPIHGNHNRQRVSLYTDDVVMFVRPTSNDLRMVIELLDRFGHVSGLRCNLAKSAATPIQCSNEDLALVSEELSCAVTNFPSTYLGLPLTLNKPTKSVLLPLVDKVADKLPGWKVPLLNRAGRLVVVKAVLTTTLIHQMTALDLPKWVFRAIDKLRRGFLWKGQEQARGGSCLVSWARVQRPLQYGGLGVLDLERMGWALRIRWLWLQKMDSTRPWAGLPIHVPLKARALFDAAVSTTVGNGDSTKFWADRWLQGKTVAEWAPDLFRAIPTKIIKRRTVSQALFNRSWVDDIKGALMVQVITDYLLIWNLVDGLVLQPDTPDNLRWKLSSSGSYSCKSAYSSMFTGTVREVWAWLLRELKLNVLPPTSSSPFLFLRTATSLEKSLQKGFNSLVILVSWELWKNRNACVFDGVRPQAQTVLTHVAAEGHLWCLAGASGLHDLLLRSAAVP